MTEDRVCLHCRLWEAIEKFHDDEWPMEHGGDVIFDPHLILGNMSDVVGEILASLPEEPRKKLLKAFDQAVRASIKQRVESGEHMDSKEQTIQ